MVEEIMSMSDSNTQSPAPQPEAKTFTQRFQEMEKSVQQLQFVVQYYNQIFQGSMEQMQLLNSDISSLKETLNAMLKLGDAGVTLNSVNTVNKMTEVSAENHKKAVAAQVKAGKLKEVEAVAGLTTIVSFSSEDIVFGYNLVSAFQDEDVKSKIIGAKVGDKVGPYSILGIYEEVQTVVGANNEQEPQEKTAVQ
jgi:hypothetical protein